MFVGFAELIGITGLAYHNAPPIPAQVVDDTGQVLFTGEHISNGQEVFLKYGLMNNGTIWGHGGYLGPDYSATALHQIGVDTRDAIAQRDYSRDFMQLTEERSEEHTSDIQSLMRISYAVFCLKKIQAHN